MSNVISFPEDYVEFEEADPITAEKMTIFLLTIMI